jgi:hypothetical protein
MAITQALCTSFKVECLTAIHDFTNGTGDTFKIALYTSSAVLGESTAAYTTTGEVVGTGYVAGGNTLTSNTPTSSGTIAFCDFDDTSWAASTITARGALVYNSSKANRAVMVLDFGLDRSSSASTFTVQMPAADSSNAIIRID